MREVKIGDKIKILHMDGEPAYDGRIGIVKCIDGKNQLHGTWGGLAIIPETDKFTILKQR